MKLWKVLSSTLLILLGFSAGIALRTTPATVSAADPTPPSALKTVAHNSTLNGDGTSTAPLGVANGAVTVAMLSPSRLPSTGQVLEFDGAGLTWQNRPAAAAHLVDSLGKDVGVFYPNTRTLRKINGTAVLLNISPSGFYVGGRSLEYTSSDCSGQPYTANDGDFWTRGFVDASQQLFFASGPTQQVTVGSWMNEVSGACHPDKAIRPLSSATVVSIASLGLTPPFHLDW